MNSLKKLTALISSEGRRRPNTLFALIFLVAIFDAIGIASIMPFIAILSNPGMIQSSQVLNFIYVIFDFDSNKNFNLFIGALVFSLLLLSIAFKAATTYLQLRFSMDMEFSLSKKLIEGYLHQPYIWFLSRNSSDLGKTILSEVNQLINQVVVPYLIVIGNAVACLALLSLLIFIEPKLALMVGIVLGSAYATIFILMKQFLSKIGLERLRANKLRFSAISECFGAIKQIKISGLESAYVSRFRDAAKIYAQHQASSQLVAFMPRFLLEAISFGGMLAVILYLLTKDDDFSKALPIIGLYALAGYRLMPAVQQIYANLTQIRFGAPGLNAIYGELQWLHNSDKTVPSNDKFHLRHSIELDHVSYQYPNTNKLTIKDLTLKIAAKSNVAIVGSSGSGKSTTVDIILCLLSPQKGALKIDGQIINTQSLRRWQNSIGYVPQQIYLTDNSIEANIAFGIPPDKVNKLAVKQAAEVANIHEFITTLPSGYSTLVGERGAQLSGGQCQRIGIARALYHNPEIIVFDEATSSLDSSTEYAVMEAIGRIKHKVTIIMIAHRLSTVQDCDKIFLLDEGALIAEGSYEQLITSNKKFKAMARV